MNGYLSQSQCPSLGIIYSVVARGSIILAQYAAHHGNFTEVSQQVLELVPTDINSKLTYATRDYMYHYICEEGVVYMCITDDVSEEVCSQMHTPLPVKGHPVSSPHGWNIPSSSDASLLINPNAHWSTEFERSRAFLFLQHIQIKCKHKFGHSIHSAKPYALNSAFSKELATDMKSYSESALHHVGFRGSVQLDSIAIRDLVDTSGYTDLEPLELLESDNESLKSYESSNVLLRDGRSCCQWWKRWRKRIIIFLIVLSVILRSGFGSAEHVIIFGCDGFGNGGMYLENATSFLPNVNKFYTDGAHTTRARDQMPSVSAPNWATIITGMGPEESGVSENYWLPPDGHSLGPLSHLPPTSGKGKVVVVAIEGIYT
ncbi:Vesicle-associated membrane protein 7 [Geodia barretti]|uniref:Vesicle-associated membrane protein 7 n=1 Tax=Geodia barretti TaxID=519541 RepID=A0AA35RPP0_GEOBA|nr:Vesicle-associated membrane protein 7 [Geodia barretti]